MAINIFQGGKSSSKPKVNSAAQSTRAQQAKAALSGPAEASNSGATAVKSNGILGKVGNFVGKAAGIASKFLPGIGGTIAKGISSIFNDPEWWQSVPGDALTLNQMLRAVITEDSTGVNVTSNGAVLPRAAIAEFTSLDPTIEDPDRATVFTPTRNMCTQYLMPEIRKVVNAVPLQGAYDYQVVIGTQATIYALWRQLKKVDYMLKHGTTYLPGMNVSAFPICQVENASWLQSTINRLEEYLRANVRLPHTLCEYLAWRFGRVYRSNNSAKAGLILYNVLSLNESISTYNSVIQDLMGRITTTQAYQAANTDMYNAYYDHDFMVEIRDDTQFQYDCKEFMLRTNLDIAATGSQFGAIPYQASNNVIAIDSSLDNPTSFMASTVSTITKFDTTDTADPAFLVPVRRARVFCFAPYGEYSITGMGKSGSSEVVSYKASLFTPCVSDPTISPTDYAWCYADIIPALYFTPDEARPSTVAATALAANLAVAINAATLCKSLDLYNKGIYLAYQVEIPNEAARVYFLDLTAISIDAGLVADSVIEVEQVYAFANLVDVTRKTSMSYAKAEKLVARDTANLVDTIDVATVADSTK